MMMSLTQSLGFETFIFIVVCLNTVVLVAQTFTELEIRGGKSQVPLSMLKTVETPGLPMSLSQCQAVFETCYFIFILRQLGGRRRTVIVIVVIVVVVYRDRISL